MNTKIYKKSIKDNKVQFILVLKKVKYMQSKKSINKLISNFFYIRYYDFDREIKFLQNFDHPNIIKFYDML